MSAVGSCASSSARSGSCSRGRVSTVPIPVAGHRRVRRVLPAARRLPPRRRVHRVVLRPVLRPAARLALRRRGLPAPDQGSSPRLPLHGSCPQAALEPGCIDRSRPSVLGMRFLPQRRRTGRPAARARVRWRRFVAAALVAAAVAVGLSVAAPEPPPTTRVVVTARALERGHEVTADDLTTVRLPPSAVPDGALRAQPDAVGTVMTGPAPAGQPVTESTAVRPGSDDAPAGTSMVAVPAGPVAGQVRPGSRVDVLDAAGGSSLARDVLVIDVVSGGSSSSGASGTHVALLAVPRRSVADVVKAAGSPPPGGVTLTVPSSA